MTHAAFRIAIVCCLVLCASLTGCASQTMANLTPGSRLETMAQDPHEHFRTTTIAAEQDRRALAEDLDLLLMTDRPTRLTRWHGR